MTRMYPYNNLKVNFPNGKIRTRSVTHTEIPEHRHEKSVRSTVYGQVFSRDHGINKMQHNANRFKKEVELIAMKNNMPINQFLVGAIIAVISAQVLTSLYFFFIY